MTGVYFGAPVTRINSAGTVLTNTVGPGGGRDRLAGQRRLHLFPVVVRGQLAEALGQLARRRARAREPSRPTSHESFTRRK